MMAAETLVQAAPEPQLVFRRRELKYFLTEEDREDLARTMAAHMEPDAYGESQVSSIYFDTPTGLIARLSLEGGEYKEKLRIRAYGEVKPDSTVFVEIKKKRDGVTYKRRVAARAQDAIASLCSQSFPGQDQVSREIDWFCHRYQPLSPSVLVTYDRCAYYARGDTDFRLTLDRDIAWRDRSHPAEGADAPNPLIPPDTTVMEVKTAIAIPRWMVDFLERREIRQASFSKYCRAYVAREQLLLQGADRTESLAAHMECPPTQAADAPHAPAHMRGRKVSYA